MVNESRVFVFIVNLAQVVFKLELAIDKVTQVGRVIGQVVLLKQVDKIIKVQLHSVILQRESNFHHNCGQQEGVNHYIEH